MAVFGQLSKEEIRKQFVYRGWLYGIVPVYVGDMTDYSPNLSVRNGVPEFVLDLVEAIVAFIVSLSPPDAPLSHSLKLTERLDGKPLESWL